MYQITDYSKTRAKQLGVIIKPSENKKKKIDVFKNGDKIASIGSITNFDYPTYVLTNGKKYADERKRLYKLRHKKDINNKDGNGFYADKILW
jgi:hypothetical protein